MTDHELIVALRGLKIAAENLLEAENTSEVMPVGEWQMRDYWAALHTAVEQAKAVLDAAEQGQANAR